MVNYDSDEVFKIIVLEGMQDLEDLIEEKEGDKSDAELDLRIEQITEKVFSEPDIFNRFLESEHSPFDKLLTAKKKYRKNAIPNIAGQSPQEIKNRLFAYFNKINLQLIPSKYLDGYIDRFMSEKMGNLEVIPTKGNVEIYAKPDEKKIIDRIFKYFISSRNKPVTFNQVFVKESVKLNEVKLKYDKIEELKSKVDGFLSDIEGLSRDTQKTELEPIKSLLELVKVQNLKDIKNNKTNYMTDIKIIGAADITGNLDLKELKSRDSIYAYWKTVDKDYGKFKKAFDNFLDKLKQLENDKLPPVLDEIIYDLKQYEQDVKSTNIKDNLKYTVNVETRTLESYMKKQKHLALLEDMLVKYKFIKLKETPDISQIRVEGGYTDKETGEKKPQGSSYLPARENKNINEISTEEYSQLGIKLEDFSTGDIEVDPLYHYAFTHPSKGAFTRTPVLENDLELIKKQLQNRARQIKTVVREEVGLAVENTLPDYLDDLKELVPSKSGEFFLPISDKLLQGHKKEGGYTFQEGKVTSKDFENKSRKIADFLRLITKIYDAGEELFRESSPASASFDSTKDSRGGNESKVPFSERLSINLGTGNDSNYLADLKQVENELKTLLNTILDYFVLPADSRYVPFDEPSIFQGKDTFTRSMKILAGVNKDDSAFSRLMFMARSVRGGKNLVNASQLQDFTFLMKELSKPEMSISIRELKTLIINNGIEPTLDVLRNMKSNQIEKDVHEEFGSYFYRILKRNGLYRNYLDQEKRVYNNPEGNFPYKNSSGNPKEYQEKYSNTRRKNYAFEGIVKHVIRNRESYMDAEEGKTKGEDSQKGETMYSDFYNAVNDLDIIKSGVELKMLEAHDNIRKMMGKPIYFNTSKLDNYEHANAAIDIMKKSFNVDISAYEITQIVNEINSFEEISIKHGIPKESVYFLKGTFR